MAAIGVTGHVHIPATAQPDIERDLRSLMADLAQPLTGYTCLAPGADQMFARVVLELGGRVSAIIPCVGYAESLDPGERTVLGELLAEASTTEFLDFPRPSEEAYMAAGRRVVDQSDLLIAVWDGQPARGPGGTADVVQYAGARGTRIIRVWPTGLLR